MVGICKVRRIEERRWPKEEVIAMAVVTQSCFATLSARYIGRTEQQRPEACLHFGRHVGLTDSSHYGLLGIGYTGRLHESISRSVGQDF